MILYNLVCTNDHEFEAWFRDGATYDKQSAAGDIDCPFCGTSRVSKAPMAPHLTRSKGGASGDDRAEVRAREVAEQILEAVNKLRRQIRENSEDVGDNFAKEARRIHYGETEERNIHGQATEEEAEDLDDEGVEFYRLPFTPKRND